MAPHILFVVADDLGFADVPFTATDSNVKAPTVGRLAAEGLVLDNYYVQPLCTPTRAAFLTGRHPVQLGLQHGVILNAVPDGLPSNETTLAELLRGAGYATHMIGKWHLGFYQPRFTPEARGFDSAFGYYTGNAEYWNHTSPCWSCGNFTAVDLHRASSDGSWEGVTDMADQYSTELFGAEAVAVIRRHAAAQNGDDQPLFLYLAFEAVHGASSCFVASGAANCAAPDGDELQAPAQFVAAQAHIASPRRRVFAGMVGALDAAMANVVEALSEQQMEPNTLLLFTTDNGAPHTHFTGDAMSNWPLRGGKGELWEGGVRGAAFLWGGALPASARRQRSQALLHASDWLPTLLHAASLAPPPCVAEALYGRDAWEELARGGGARRYAVRDQLLHNADVVSGQAAARLGDYKLLRNVPPGSWGADLREAPSERDREGGAGEAVADPSGAEAVSSAVRRGKRKSYLFNVVADPEEREDLYAEPAHWRVRASLEALLEGAARIEAPPRRFAPDPAAAPAPLPQRRVCTPSPAGPMLCDEPIGVWRPWQPDPALSSARAGASRVFSAIIGDGPVAVGLLLVTLAACAACCALLRLRGVSRAKADAALTSIDEDDAGDGVSTRSASLDGGDMLQCDGLLGRTLPGRVRSTLCHPSRSDFRALAAAGLCLLLPVGALLLISIESSPGHASAGRFAKCNAGTVPIAQDNAMEELIAPTKSATMASESEPNALPNDIVLFLTDDQDQMLGGGFEWPSRDAPTPMRKTRTLLADAGATATNFFAHTPICCPSRAQLLTGRYFHNIKVVPGGSGVNANESCMHVNLSKVQGSSFPAQLQQLGYTTGLFGKYLNHWVGMGEVARGLRPEGFDAWFANGGGDYIAPQFDAAGMQFAGITDGTWVGTDEDYTTSVVGNLSAGWIHSVALRRGARPPLFAYVAPKTVHEPFVPAPWHARAWAPDWPSHEPRPVGCWNASAATRSEHHSTVASQPMLSDAGANVIGGVHRNRWRALLAVDDVVEAVLGACARARSLERTFFFFTSDHGFSLGEFNMLMDKRHVYDWHTRIPFLVRGPGIAPFSQLEAPATLVDLAPTLLSIAGASADIVDALDGKSLLPLLVDRSRVEPGALAAPARGYLERAGDSHAYRRAWREAVLIEHYFVSNNIKCVRNCSFSSSSIGLRGSYPKEDVHCTDVLQRTGCWGTIDYPEAQPWCTQDCYPTESEANNFVALRAPGTGARSFANALYAEFQIGNQENSDLQFESPSFVELYDAANDPWMLNNLAEASTANVQTAKSRMQTQLHEWLQCTGRSCR